MSVDGHTPYTAEDFTPEEIARENILAMAVIRDGAQICKYCGAQDQELETWATCEAFRTMQRQAEAR